MSIRTLLLIDNDQRFLNIWKEFLTSHGYEVISATNTQAARELIRAETFNLAILDIRMENDDDENDFSGLDLALEIDPSIPKVILTAFPTWEIVQETLGPRLNHLPLAVDFIAKKEGPVMLLHAIDWQLSHPNLRRNVLDSLEVQTLMAVPERIKYLGPSEASTRLHHSFEMTSREIKTLRDQENMKAGQFHKWGLGLAVTGTILILIGAVMVLLDSSISTVLPLISGVISEVIGILFFRQEKQKYDRVWDLIEKQNELNDIGILITICDVLTSPTDREACKKNMIKKASERWFKAQDGRL